MLSKTLLRQRALITQSARSFSLWGQVTAAPADPILGLNDTFKKDNNPKKVLLGMGAYRDNDGKPYILDCVKKAERIIVDNGMDHEYAGIDGIPSYKEKCAALAYGADSDIVTDKRYVACQSISGTGSLRVGLDFMKAWYPNKTAKVYVPNPTWPTHRGIAEKAGFEWVNYRYYDSAKKGFDLVGMLEDLDKADNESIIVFHVCAHNPTGCDPTIEEWKQILEVVKRKNHFAAFDSAYQGFASGDLEKDAASLRLFAKEYSRICLFQSFAKNFGLYGERAGCVSFVADSPTEANILTSRVKQIARPMYSNPPIHGARIVDIILSDADLTANWHQELRNMSGRMAQMRTGLVAALKSHGSVHDWSHVTSQIGMFAYTGLSTAQVDKLQADYSIYMTADGRISIAGLNTHNLDYIADAFHQVSKDSAL
jgi:aspartate aminotransferase